MSSLTWLLFSDIWLVEDLAEEFLRLEFLILALLLHILPALGDWQKKWHTVRIIKIEPLQINKMNLIYRLKSIKYFGTCQAWVLVLVNIKSRALEISNQNMKVWNVIVIVVLLFCECICTYSCILSFIFSFFIF